MQKEYPAWVNGASLFFLTTEPWPSQYRCVGMVTTRCLGCRLKAVSSCARTESRRFVGQFTRSELGMVSHGAFLQSKSLQSIYLVVTGEVDLLMRDA